MDSTQLASILLVDDDNFARVTLEGALRSSGFDVEVSVKSAHEALQQVSQNGVDIAILDLDLGVGPSGIDLAIGLRTRWPQIGIIFLTTYHDPRLTDLKNKILPKGARYILKSELESVSQLISVVLQTKHKPFISNISHIDRFEELSEIQIQVWRLIASGLSSGEIAHIRGVSEKAIEATIARLYLSLGIKREKTINPRVLLVNAYYRHAGKSL